MSATLDRSSQLSDELMTIDDIAAMLKLSRTHVRNVVVKRSGFPERSPASGASRPRWSRAAVVRYVCGESKDYAPDYAQEAI